MVPAVKSPPVVTLPPGTFVVHPSAGVTGLPQVSDEVAVKACVPIGARLAAPGDTLTAARSPGSTVTDALPVTLPAVATMAPLKGPRVQPAVKTPAWVMAPAAPTTPHTTAGDVSTLLHASRAVTVKDCVAPDFTLADAGETDKDATGPGTMVTDAEPLTPPTVAVTPVAKVPALHDAVSTPPEVMVPAPGAADQVKTAVGTTLLAASYAVAVKVCAPPAPTVAEAGDTVRWSTAPGWNGKAPRSLPEVPTPRAGEPEVRWKSRLARATYCGSTLSVLLPWVTDEKLVELPHTSLYELVRLAPLVLRARP